jgi:hypothetical protein
MSKFDKKTIATVLAFAALFGNKTSATTVNPQTVGAVGGAASSHSEKLKKTQGMGIGAKVAIGAAALVGAYATANEVLGDTGLVNHPAMGRYTIKKTIGYLMRDFKKEEALIDNIVEFIDNSGANEVFELFSKKLKNLGIDVKSLLSGNFLPNVTQTQKQEILKAKNEILAENKNLVSNIKIDKYSLGFNTEEDKNVTKLELLNLLPIISISLKSISENLKDFSYHSTGVFKSDLSKNSVFLGNEDINFILTLNNDGSLTIKGCAKKYLDPLSGKIIDNFNYQFTISAPKK